MVINREREGAVTISGGYAQNSRAGLQETGGRSANVGSSTAKQSAPACPLTPLARTTRQQLKCLEQRMAAVVNHAAKLNK